MLFSVPVWGWACVAGVVSVGFVATLRVIARGVSPGGDVRPDREKRRARWRAYAVVLLLLALLLGANLLRPEPASAILFLYSAMFLAIPMALLPVRGRIVRAVLAQRRNPHAPAKPDRFMTVWICAVLSCAVIGAVAALMTTPYGHAG
ncbi:hypothetical protein GCM10009801_18110 [Streptomyces albiaxialis]|uniref:Transmembrane protein n=1 Tax=Streptomyces albiaxialis TaxID=329523 RepID=A0ABN2VQ14_9ACTN